MLVGVRVLTVLLMVCSCVFPSRIELILFVFTINGVIWNNDLQDSQGASIAAFCIKDISNQ